MAKTKQKDILAKLADAGEEAFSRVAGSQTTARVVETVNGMRERLDDLQKRVTGLDDLERRITELEKTVAEQSKPKTTRSRSSSGTARKSPSARSATRKKSSG